MDLAELPAKQGMRRRHVLHGDPKQLNEKPRSPQASAHRLGGPGTRSIAIFPRGSARRPRYSSTSGTTFGITSNGT